MSRALDELRTHLADRMAPLLDAWADESVVRAAITEATADWAVIRKDYPHRDDHPLDEVRYGHKLVATLPFVPETDDEAAEREARMAARLWDAEDGPPLERVSVLQLLSQDTWWRMRIDRPGSIRDLPGEPMPTAPVRLEEMSHDHRLALLALLRRNAEKYKSQADWALAGVRGPDGDMASDAFERECDEQWNTPDAEWIEEQPLVQALVHWTTPYAESPLTYQDMETAPRGGSTIIVVVDADGGLHRAFWDRSWGHWTEVDEHGLFGELTRLPRGWRELRDDERQSPDQECEDPYDEPPVC